MAPTKIYALTILTLYVILAKAETDQVSDHEGTQGHEDDESSEGSGEFKPQGRLYSLSTCEYRMQPGYSCLSCSKALHCYISNVAIIVDCRGLFPYCRDGRCSMYRETTCGSVTHNSPLTTLNTTIYHPVQGVKENVTSAVESHSDAQMIATEINPAVSGEKIDSMDKVESIPEDIAQKKLNTPIKVIDNDGTRDNLVNSR